MLRTNATVKAITLIMMILLVCRCEHSGGDYNSLSHIPTLDSLLSKTYNHPDSSTLLLNDLNNSGFYKEATLLMEKSDWNSFFVGRGSFDNIVEPVFTVGAIDHIKGGANNYDIIILNENHSFPYQRDFARELAVSLIPFGYNQIGLEALCSGSYIRREKPLCYDEGFYTKEPSFALFIAASQMEGYDIFGYEECELFTETRDEKMAQNVLKNWNPKKGKLLIYCGWDHAMKIEGRLAYILEERTSYRILTINQTNLNPLMPNKAQEKVRNSIKSITFRGVEKTSILLDELGNASTLRNLYDLEVIYPDKISKYLHKSLSVKELISSNNRNYYGWKNLKRYYNDSCRIVPVVILSREYESSTIDLMRDNLYLINQ
jgi:hypothetical protein